MIKKWLLTILLLAFFVNAYASNWINYLGNQSCTLQEYHEPKTVNELLKRIAEAISKGYRIKAVGNGYSISNIASSDGCLVNLKYLNSVLAVDTQKMQVKVETGITLLELNEILSEYGLTLPNQAAISQISLGGALSTAVHGTGHTGTLSDFIRGIDLITADNQILHLSKESDFDAFSAASTSLGTLGIIYSVTLQCETLFYLGTRTETTNIENIIEQYKIFQHSNDFFHFFWNVETDEVIVNCLNRCRTNEKQYQHSNDCKPSYQALAWYTIDQNDKDLFSEIAIPVDCLPVALRKIQQLAKKYREHGAQIADIHVRFVEQDQLSLLSPTSDGPKAYITFCIFEEDKYLSFYKEFEEAMYAYGGRPHWGKLNFLNYEKALPLYREKLQKFIEVKKRLDPNNVFSNSFSDQLLLH